MFDEIEISSVVHKLGESLRLYFPVVKKSGRVKKIEWVISVENVANAKRWVEINWKVEVRKGKLGKKSKRVISVK